MGGPGDDTLSGDDGPDRIFAQRGVDTVNGGAGDERSLWALARVDVTGQPNEPADTLHGGPGNDVFHVRDGEADTVDCGDGNDVVLADFKDQVSPDCETVKRHVPNPRSRPDDQEKHSKGKPDKSRLKALEAAPGYPRGGGAPSPRGPCTCRSGRSKRRAPRPHRRGRSPRQVLEPPCTS